MTHRDMFNSAKEMPYKSLPKGYGWVSGGTWNGIHWSLYQPDSDIGTLKNLIKCKD